MAAHRQHGEHPKHRPLAAAAPRRLHEARDWPEGRIAFNPRSERAQGKRAGAIPDTVSLAELRPTQTTVGFREVAQKRLRWRDGRKASSLRRSRLPVVRGPKGQLFILDHHHLARALYEEGVERVSVEIVSDLSMLSAGEFWEVCEERSWCHPYDAAGRLHAASALPRTVGELTDDPYRSLASALRRAGGFAKSAANYSEFRWAEFLRRHIPRAELDADFDQAVRSALVLASSAAAAHLPGWLEPVRAD